MSCHDIPDLVSDEDSFALRLVRGFTNPVLCRIVFHCFEQLVRLFGQYKCSGPEVKLVFSMDVLHTMNPIREEVLSRQLNATWEVIHFLVLAQPLEEAILQ